MKKNIMISIVVIALLFNIYIANAADNSIQYDLNELQGILINESLVVKKIEADEKLLTLKYQEDIKDYREGPYTYSFYNAEMTVSKLNENLKKSIKDFDSTDINYYNNAKMSYKNMVANRTAQIKYYEPIIFKKNQAASVKENEILKSKFTIQKDYYSLMVAEKEIELLEKDITNLKKQIETEKLKTDYGVSTTISVDELSNKLITMENTLNISKNNFDLMKERMKTTLNIKVEEELNLKFSLPKKEEELTCSVGDTIKNMKEKSLDLESIKNNTKICNDVYEKFKLAYQKNNEYEISTADMSSEERDTFTTSELELTIAQSKEKNFERELEIYAKKVYYAYKKSLQDLDASNNDLNLLKDKEKVLELNYQQGLISELQYNLQKQEIIRKKFDADKALIAYENARQNLELANKGIMVK